MDFEDILYFDYKSNEGVTLNLNFVGTFLWYTDVKGPVTFTFLPHGFDVVYKNFLLKFDEKGGVTIYSDYSPKTFRKYPPTSLTSFEISEEDFQTIRNGIINLLETYPKKTIGKKTYQFNPFVMKKDLE